MPKHPGILSTKKMGFAPKFATKEFIDWAHLAKLYPTKANEIKRHRKSQTQLRRILLRELRNG